jgi:hypothetical protein
MNEIKRMQQLAGILSEIKVNAPDKLSVLKRGLERVLEGDKEFTEEDEQIEEIDNYIRQIHNSDNEDEIEEILSNYLYNDSGMIQDYLSMALEKSESPFLK